MDQRVRPVTLAIIGAGNRGGEVYADYCARHPEDARVVAVADPDAIRRDRMAERHGLDPGHCYEHADALFDAPKMADAVVIATPDQHHVVPAIRALEAGYDILLEKPLAPDFDQLQQLRTAAAGRADAVTIAHVLRYTPFFVAIKQMLNDGTIGRLQGIEHTENIGFWHYVHSYVRGNWRSATTASPLILAKACHDLDILRWMADAPCMRVASFGDLRHFHPGEAPAGAPEHCLDGCPVEDSCPFHASRFYVDHLRDWQGGPVTTITDDLTVSGRLDSLRKGQYGRCVYRCDNDVADHQVTILQFANGVTATLTVTAFSQENTRVVRYLGSHGEIRGDLERGDIEVVRFKPAPHVASPAGAPGRGQLGDVTAPGVASGAAPSERIEIPLSEKAAAAPPWGAFVGHAGGDDGLMRDFVQRLRSRLAGNEVPRAQTSLTESIDSHLMAFAAEESRTTGRIVRPRDLTQQEHDNRT